MWFTAWILITKMAAGCPIASSHFENHFSLAMQFGSKHPESHQHLTTFLDFTLILLVLLYCMYPGTCVSSKIQEIPDLGFIGLYLDSFGLPEHYYTTTIAAAVAAWLHDDYHDGDGNHDDDCDGRVTTTTMASDNFITVRLPVNCSKEEEGLKVVEQVQKESQNNNGHTGD
jgi:hypothetical protein